MVVQHNLTAMNSNRMLGVTTKTQAKSTEKLSSGYKINRAADDAAGLSISEKMRKQIRGLTQASLNAQDGISAVQTAEGALNEVQDMLQRMNELAVKAANGTMSENDRTYIQNEVDQLTTEIDRVAETTKFNETYLLKGDKTADSDYTFTYGATAGTTSYALKDGVTLFDENGKKVEAGTVLDTTKKYYKDYKAGTAAADGDFDGTTDTDKNKVVLYDGATGEAVAIGKVEYKNKANYYSTKVGTEQDPKDNAFSTSKLDNAYYDKDGNKIAENALSNYLKTTDGTTINVKDGVKLYDANGNDVTANVQGTQFSAKATTGALTLSLHVGADATSNNQISLDITAMSAERLGVAGLKVDGSDDTNALSAVDTIKEAIQKVSTQRSALGAIQNRLEHTINNLDNVVENTTSAESQIRDTDMATEMVKYSNNNILAQAGQAMLAQANQSNQGVLSLLQ
jgi:flagellin